MLQLKAAFEDLNNEIADLKEKLNNASMREESHKKIETDLRKCITKKGEEIDILQKRVTSLLTENKGWRAAIETEMELEEFKRTLDPDGANQELQKAREEISKLKRTLAETEEDRDKQSAAADQMATLVNAQDKHIIILEKKNAELEKRLSKCQDDNCEGENVCGMSHRHKGKKDIPCRYFRGGRGKCVKKNCQFLHHEDPELDLSGAKDTTPNRSAKPKDKGRKDSISKRTKSTDGRIIGASVGSPKRGNKGGYVVNKEPREGERKKVKARQARERSRDRSPLRGDLRDRSRSPIRGEREKGNHRVRKRSRSDSRENKSGDSEINITFDSNPKREKLDEGDDEQERGQNRPVGMFSSASYRNRGASATQTSGALDQNKDLKHGTNSNCGQFQGQFGGYRTGNQPQARPSQEPGRQGSSQEFGGQWANPWPPMNPYGYGNMHPMHMPPYYDPRNNPGYIPPESRFQEINENQDFHKGGPLATTSTGPRSKQQGGDISQDPYQLNYAKMIQGNKKAHTGQLNVELTNTNEALARARQRTNQIPGHPSGGETLAMARQRASQNPGQTSGSEALAMARHRAMNSLQRGMNQKGQDTKQMAQNIYKGHGQ